MKGFSQRILIFAAVLFIALGVLFRYGSVFNELWLDEIYSLKLLSSVQSPWQIFSLAEDNNHYLNSVWLFVTRPEVNVFVLRLPSFVCGILTMLLCLALCWREGALQTFFGSILFSMSYVLVLYSTEARGYSSMLLFSALAFYLFERYRRERHTVTALCFWLSCVGGIFSHFVFAHVFFAFLIYGFALLIRQELRPPSFLKIMGVPGTLIAALLVLRFQGLHIAGGPQGSRLEVLLNALAVPYGAAELSPSNPQAGVITLGVALLILGIFAQQIWTLRKRKDPTMWFYFAIVFLVPLITLVVLKPEVFVLRYVLPSIFFSYFLLVGFLSSLYNRGAVGRVIVIALLSCFLFGNQRMLMQLLGYGRGNYTEALQFIAEHSSEETLTIGGDQDFRNGLLVRYYAEASDLPKPVRYIDDQYPMAPDVSWVIVETQDQYQIPEFRIPDSPLVFAKAFESAPLSGARWFVYCKESACPSVLKLQ